MRKFRSHSFPVLLSTTVLNDSTALHIEDTFKMPHCHIYYLIIIIAMTFMYREFWKADQSPIHSAFASL